MAQATRGFVPQRNNFYYTAAVGSMSVLQSDFGDLPQKEMAGTGLLELTKDEENRYVLLSGNTENDITYGDYQLNNAYLSVYVSGTDLSKTSGVPPNLSLWAVNPNYPIRPGSFTFATADDYVTGGNVGDKLVVFNSTRAGGRHVYKAETFEGDNAAVLKFPSIVANSQGVQEFTLQQSRSDSTSFSHFMILDDWAKGAGFTMCNYDANLKMQYDGIFMTLYNNADIISIAGEPTKILRISSDNNYYYLDISYMPDMQDIPALQCPRVTMDQAGGWIYKNVGAEAFGGEDSSMWIDWELDANAGKFKSPSTNTTIFDTFKSTINYTNPYNETDENPLVSTVMEITDDGSQSGGNGKCLRIYHNWGGATQYTGTIKNALIEQYMGKPSDAVPQVAMAGIYNLPAPVVAEVGHDLKGDRRTIIPEISLDMRIDKLAPCPRWAIEQSASGGTTTWGAVDQSTALYYDNKAANWNIAATGPTAAGYIDWGNESLSTLRSVAIVFSNYKPLDTHKTLDDFVNYGLYNSYYNGNTSEGIVGGVIIRTLDIDGQQDDDNAFAYATPLSVTRNPDLNAPYGTDNTESGYDTTTKAGDIGYYGMGRFLSGTMGAADSFGPHLIQNKPLFNNATRGTAFSESGSEREVGIPLNKYFNVKFFIDAQATNWSGSNSLAPYRYFPRGDGAGANYNGGVAMRAIFDFQEATGDVEGSATAQEEGQSSQSLLPFLDIPFPVGENNAAIDDIPNYSLNTNSFDQPEGTIVNTRRLMYPKHMTIWVQNYRWIKGSSTNGSWYKYGDDTIYSEPLTAMETEVYIDNITLTNFTHPVLNLSAPQTNYVRGSFENQTQKSPLYTITGTIADTTRKVMTAFVSGGSTYGASGPSYASTYAQYQETSQGNYLLFGFEDKDWLPNTATDSRYGYIHMSDFATGDWANIQQMLPALSSGAIFSMPKDLATNNIRDLGNQFEGSAYRTSGSGTDAITSQAGSCVVADTMTGATNKTGFALGSGANTIFSHDGFTQKGFMQLYVSGAATVYPGYTEWTKREHIIASTKVTAVADTAPGLDEFSIEVENPSVFTQNLDDTYVIYLYGNIDGNTERLTGLKLAGNNSIAGNKITFSSKVTDADIGNSYKICKEELLSQLWVGPEKYWATIMAASDGTWAQRTFGQFALVTETPSDTNQDQLGSTWNEWLYHYNTADEGTVGKSAVYTNTWDLRTAAANSMLVTTFDFGHGTLEDGGGFVDDIPVVKGYYSTFKLGSMIDWMGRDRNTFTQFLKLGGFVSNKCTIATTNHATALFHPQFIYEYSDPIPEVGNLSVGPTWNLLETGTNVYELTNENLNSVTFNWSEESDDTWYRYFIISDVGVNNKYATCRIHAPLNNSPSGFDVVASFTATDPVSGSTLAIDATGSTSVAATATITITDYTELNTGDKVNLVATDGTNYDFTCGDQSSVNGTWEATTSNDATATNLMNVINTSSGPAGTRFTATVDGAVVTVTQAVAGADGNTTVTLTESGGSGMSKTNFTGGAAYVLPYSQINGLAGYAPEFTHTTLEKMRISGTNTLISGASTFSTVVHSIPNSSMDANACTLFSIGGGGPSIGSSAGIECVLSGNKLLYDQKGLSSALTGNTFIPYDGLTPFNVIVVFDEDAAGPANLHVYLNGVLEMSASGVEAPSGSAFATTAAGHLTGSTYIGGRYNNNTPYHGKIEEFCWYDSAIEVAPRQGEHIFNTVNTLDITGSTNKTHHTRLFVFDYHNIRGESAKDVGRTNQTKWRATTL